MKGPIPRPRALARKIFQWFREFAWIVAFLVIALPAISKNLHAQQVEYTPPIRFGIISPEVRDSLAADWDRHLFDEPYLERGYCGYYEKGIFAGEIAWIVTRTTPPDLIVGQPTQSSIDFRCFSFNAIPIHVHPPRNCPTPLGPCTREGLYAYQCMPSENDRRNLTYYAYPFGVVQCERKGLRTFWPVGVAGT